MAGQLTIDGREVLEPIAPAPERCEVLPLFTAPQTLRGQLAAELDTLQDACPGAAERESAPESAREPTLRRCTSPADPVHRAKMDAGRERAQLERDARSVARVEAWRRWSRAGGRGPMPELPRDADFVTAREHGSRWAS
jgi:hypothetical protein